MTEYNPEVYLAGALLIDAASVFAHIRGRVDSADFADEQCRAVYDAVVEMTETRETIDPASVLEHKHAELTDDFIKTAMATAPTLAYDTDYAERVHAAAAKRQLIQILDDATSTLILGGSVDDIRSGIMSALETTGNVKALVYSQEAARDTYTLLNDRATGKVFEISTGYKYLDKLLDGGLKKSGMYILAARPGGGKTTLGLNIAENAAKAGTTTLYITLEMSVIQLQEKRLSMASGLSMEQLHKVGTNEDVWKRIAMASDNTGKTPLIFNRQSVVTPALVERMARSCNAELVVIDYLQLLKESEGRTLYEKTTALSKALKVMACSLNIPVLCLCQLNRQSAEGEPKVYDLRDSGGLEQDADAVMLLHLPEGRANGETPTDLQLILAKSRYSSTGRMDLLWYMQTGRILEAEYGNAI